MTTTELVTATSPALPAIRSASARRYARKSKSGRTLKLYGDAWREFEHFAARQGEPSLPATPATVIDYLCALADGGAKVSTIDVKRAAIGWRHRAGNLPDPTAYEDVRAVMAGIRREIGTAPQRKAPATLDVIRQMVNALPDSLQGKRDRALLLLGYFGAFRRSELVGVDVEDMKINGVMQITVKRSKTDQEGEGRAKTFARLDDKTICPVAALREWMDTAGIHSGAIFRRIDRWGCVHERMTAQSVALVVKAMAERAGLDHRQFSGHSLRAGFVTQGILNGARESEIMEQTWHESTQGLRPYVRLAGRGALAAMRAAAGA